MYCLLDEMTMLRNVTKSDEEKLVIILRSNNSKLFEAFIAAPYFITNSENDLTNVFEKEPGNLYKRIAQFQQFISRNSCDVLDGNRTWPLSESLKIIRWKLINKGTYADNLVLFQQFMCDNLVSKAMFLAIELDWDIIAKTVSGKLQISGQNLFLKKSPEAVNFAHFQQSRCPDSEVPGKILCWHSNLTEIWCMYYCNTQWSPDTDKPIYLQQIAAIINGGLGNFAVKQTRPKYYVH